MLSELEKVYANFYPMPFEPMQELAIGLKHFSSDDGLVHDKSDLVFLSNVCSDVKHKTNSYPKREPTIYAI